MDDRGVETTENFLHVQHSPNGTSPFPCVDPDPSQLQVILIKFLSCLELVEMPFGANSCEPNESCIRWRSRYPTVRDNFGVCL